MTAAELRRIKLMGMLRFGKRLSIGNVAEHLDISESTARRFIGQMEKKGEVTRVYGGVQLAPKLSLEHTFNVSLSNREKEKCIIGQRVAEIVCDHDRIFLDSGTTVYRMTEALSIRIQSSQLDNLGVLTNSIIHLETMAPWCKTILKFC